jgi:hypothetical protein
MNILNRTHFHHFRVTSCFVLIFLLSLATPSIAQATDDLNKAEDLSNEINALKKELRQARESEDLRLQHIETILKSNSAKTVAAPQPAVKAAPAETSPHQTVKSANLLTVCSQGCDFNNLQTAVNAAEPGAEIDVAPEIVGGCALLNKPLHLVGKKTADGRRAHLAGGVCMGKGPLIVNAANVVIEGFEISNVNVDSGNGACIRLDPGTNNLVIKDIYCHDNQEGILGNSSGLLLIENSVFVNNGFNARAHGLYINGGDEVLIRHTQILSTQNSGHSLKSGARKLTVEDSIIAALNGRNSRAIDAYAGGEIVLLRNIIQQGPQSENSDEIGLAMQTASLFPDGHSLRMEGNWVISDPQGRGILFRGQKLGPIILQNNTFIGLKGIGFDGVQDINNRWFVNRQQAGLPEFDGSLSSLPKK